MGRVTFWPIPRAVDVEAHHYPKMWKRNMFFLYSGAFLIAFQVQRYGHMCRQSSMRVGEYMDWGSHNAPKRVRYPTV